MVIVLFFNMLFDVDGFVLDISLIDYGFELLELCGLIYLMGKFVFDYGVVYLLGNGFGWM